eukprot:763612-Hanusia_phi.AAC.26
MGPINASTTSGKCASITSRLRPAHCDDWDVPGSCKAPKTGTCVSEDCSAPGVHQPILPCTGSSDPWPSLSAQCLVTAQLHDLHIFCFISSNHVKQEGETGSYSLWLFIIRREVGELSKGR